MGRPKKIDRNALLDEAENIVRDQGPSALTIDALAKAMGITKGGVQYSFASKDDLIQAMTDRWTTQYQEKFAQLAGPDPSESQALAAYVEAARTAGSMNQSRASALLVHLLQDPSQLTASRDWYRDTLGKVSNPSTKSGRVRRLAFLATEGIFLLRFGGLLDVSDQELADIFSDLKALVETEKL